MPTISLRLTDEEHAQLTAWARDGKRSVQKEIIWRLFSKEPKVVIDEPKIRIEGPLRTPPAAPSITHRPASASVADDPHFKPDFGGKIK